MVCEGCLKHISLYEYWCGSLREQGMIVEGVFVVHIKSDMVVVGAGLKGLVSERGVNLAWYIIFLGVVHKWMVLVVIVITITTRGTGLLLVAGTGTFNSLITTQEFEGKSCIIVTRNWRQPLQWPMSSMRQIRLKIRMKTSATSKN